MSYNNFLDMLTTLSNDVLAAASSRMYGSNQQTYSDRIWRIGTTSRQQLRNTIAEQFTNGTVSAVKLSRAIERHLNANSGCPQWTMQRLNRLTAKQRAQSRVGLLSNAAGNSPCKPPSTRRRNILLYNALRLARNEIQVIHNDAVDRIAARQPWVKQEDIVLSSSHPCCDECDRIAKASPHPAGTVILPIHVQCLCWKRMRLPDPQVFANRLANWRDGRHDAELDGYAAWLGWDASNRSNDLLTSALRSQILQATADALVDFLTLTPEELLDQLF